MLFRYADVLLMRAEAMVRNGENGDEYLAMVRRRVGESPRHATLATLLDERMLELSWEGWRRNDLIRFGEFARAYTHHTPLPGEANGWSTCFPLPGDFLAITGCKQNPGY